MSAHRPPVKLEVFLSPSGVFSNINRCSINQRFLPQRVYIHIVYDDDDDNIHLFV